MYCGPNAVAYLTGWTRDQVWLHIRWFRELNGERLTDHPRGGTTAGECRSALERAGYDVERVFYGKRVRYGDFVRGEGRTGCWLLRQHGHLFARKPGDPVQCPDAIIISAWRVTRRQEAAA